MVMVKRAARSKLNASIIGFGPSLVIVIFFWVWSAQDYLFAAPLPAGPDDQEQSAAAIRPVLLRFPRVHISSPIQNFLTDQSELTVSGTYQYANSVVVNGIPASLSENGTFTAEHIPLKEGGNLIRAAAQSAAGSSSDAREGEADFTMPEIVSMEPPLPIYTNQPSITITGQASEPLQEINLGGVVGALLGDGSQFIFQDFALPEEDSEGTFIYMIDLAGNTTRPNFIPVVHDVTLPLVSIENIQEGAILNNPAPVVRVRVIDSHSDPASVKVNGVPALPDGEDTYSASVDLSGADGNRTITAEARDLAGNNQSVSIQVILDMVPPVIAITTPDEGFLTNQSAITVSGTYDQANVISVNGVQAALNGGAFTAANVPLAEGENTITVTATDNSGTSTITQTVVLDTIPPILNMNPALDQRKGMTELPYSFTAVVQDPDPTPLEYQFEINGAVTQPYSPNNIFSYTPASTESGNKTLTVKARDMGGEANQNIGIYFYRNPT